MQQAMSVRCTHCKHQLKTTRGSKSNTRAARFTVSIKGRKMLTPKMHVNLKTIQSRKPWKHIP